MTDIFEGRTRNLGDPGFDGAAVTSSDDNDLATTARCLYIGGAGNVAVITAGGSTVTFVAVNAGSFLPVRAARVLATGTTATSIVALW